MSKTRSAAVAVFAAAGLFLAGCGSSATDEEAPTSEPAGPSPLASFDPCAVFSQGELQSLGVEQSGEPVDQGIGESGCEYETESSLIAVYKGADQSFPQHWEERRDNFAVFESNKIGARDGIKLVTTGSVDQGICNQAIDSGGGTVSVQVTLVASQAEGNDPCAKAMEIAELIEPKLPA